MKFIFIVDSFPCISETFILNQITGLIDLGHEVIIFSADRPSERDFHDDIRKYDLLKKTYYHNDRPSNRIKRLLWAVFMIFSYGHRNFKAVVNSLNFFKYGKEAFSLTYLYKVMLFLGIGESDIMFCHYGTNGNFAVLMKELGIRGKIVTMFHGYDIRRGIKHGGEIYRKLFEQGDCILSISDYNYKHLVEFGAPKEKIITHPVGIDLQRYTFKQRSLQEEEHEIKILTVSRLVEEKGIAYGIEALRILVHERGLKQCRYYVIGDGPLRYELEALVAKYELRDHVIFLGHQLQKSVIEMLHQSHIFFLPSIAEALPVVVMEASATGLSVVATQVGSIRQLIMDQESGYIVPCCDVSAMSQKLEYLIDHPQLWGPMGKQGRQHIENTYDIQKLNERLVYHCQALRDHE